MSHIFETVRPGSADTTLLRSLGLQTCATKLHVETHLGDVKPFAEDEPPEQQTVIAVYVTAYPARAFRFEIVRRSENFDGMEKLSVRTGSGSLEDFWEMALAIAGNMLVVTAAEPVRQEAQVNGK